MSRIIVTRLGGAGDLLMTEPVLQALHDKYSNCSITYRTHRHYYDLLLFHPLIDNILCTRTGCWNLNPTGYDIDINLHGVIEDAPSGVHGVDAFAKAAGVELSRRTPVLHLTGTKRPVVTEDDRYPVVSHPDVKEPEEVDIAVHLPHTPRNLSWRGGVILVDRLRDYFNTNMEFPTIRIVGQSTMEAGKSNLLKMAWDIKKSKMFVGPDSAGIHIAAALGIPTVASFTKEFPASIRSYPGVINIEDNFEQICETSLAVYKKLKS